MKYTIKAILYCLIRLDFKGAYAIWDFYRNPDEWEENEPKTKTE